MWEVSERIFQAGCDPFPELKTETPVKVRGIPWQPHPWTQTQLCFWVFHRQNFPLLHLGLVGGRASFPTCSSHSVRVTTQPASDMPNGQPQCQHVPHSQRGGERPIQFILHIKGLKCRLHHITDMRETAISIDLSGESHSMLPNQWRPYGRQRVRQHKQTNKEVRTNIMINRLC